jgi:PDZ domain-containing secreted protein
LKDFPLILLFVLSEATLEDLQTGNNVAGIGALDRD